MSLTTKTKKWLEKNAAISLKGKTVVVTGANSGVGYKTAETMLYLGARVILACRNPQRANEARNKLSAEYSESDVSEMLLDLADFSSIDAFVSKIKEQGIDIDVFVNNAGVLHQPCKKTKDGFELVIGTVGSIVGLNKGFGGWGYPEVNRIYRKVTTGAEELIAFTEKEIGL